MSHGRAVLPPQVREALAEWKEEEQRPPAKPKAPKRRRPPVASRRPPMSPDAEQAARVREARRALVARGYGWLFESDEL